MSHGAQRDPVTQAELDDLLASRGSTEMVPILKHKADNGVMRELKHVALRGCDAHVRALAECAEGRLVSVVWYCRAFSKAVDKCMHEFGNDEALKDELRRRHGAKYPRAVKGYRESSNAKGEKKEVQMLQDTCKRDSK